MVCISLRIAAIDGRSSVYSPLRRGLAGVRLEEADEMLRISAIAKTEQVVAAPHLAKKNVIVEMGKLRGRLRERKSKTNRMSAAVSVPSATGKH